MLASPVHAPVQRRAPALLCGLRAVRSVVPGTMADRISYLIAPDGKIAAVHASMNPDGHIDATLKAAEKFKK